MYEFCTAKRNGPLSQSLEGGPQQFQYGEQLYDLAALTLSQSFLLWSQSLDRLTGDHRVWLDAYRGYWARMKEMTPHVAAIFSYLERFWVERGGGTAAISQEEEGEGAVLYFRQRMYRLWAQCILEPNEARLLAVLDASIWASEPSAAAEDLVASYKLLSVPFAPGTGSGPSRVPTGIRLFQDRLLPWYRERLAQRATEFLASMPTAPDGSMDLEGARAIHAGFQRESERARVYLGEEALGLVRETLKKALLEPVMPRLQALLEAHLAESPEPLEGLTVIYRLAALRRTLIPLLGPAFTAGLLARSTPSHTLEYGALMHLWLESSALLTHAFKEHEAMRRARDSCFTQLMKLALPGPFASWSDALLRHQAGSSEGELEAVARLLAYAEDKQAFISAYQQRLALRLLSSTYELGREQLVIAGLKRALGGALAQPFDRMLADMQPGVGETEAHSKKRGRTASTSRTAAPGPVAAVHILAQNVWPFPGAPEDTRTVLLPPAFQHLCSTQEASYHQAHPKRRLQWHPELSTVEVEFGMGVPVRMTVAQFVVMEAMEYRPQDMAALSLKTGLEAAAIHRALEQPIAAGLVHPTQLALSSAFTHPPDTILDLTAYAHRPHPGSPSETDATPLATGPDHGASSRIQPIIQAATIRLLKQSMEVLGLSEIVQGLGAMGLLVPVEAGEVERALETLLARDFVTRDRDGYKYLP